MSREMRELLTESFTEVLEQMAFMFVEEAEEDEIPEQSTGIAASINYSGESSGSIAVLLTQDTAGELAANVLGIDEDDENIDEMRADSVRELLNVTCGQFLTRKYGEELVFDLSVPEISMVDNAAWKNWYDDDEAIKVLVDDSPAMIRYSFD